MRHFFIIIFICLGISSNAQTSPYKDYYKEESLKKMVEKNDIEAMNQLGLLYYHSDILHKEEKAVELFEKASAKGHKHAMYNLALCYILGKGVDRDLKKGFNLLCNVSETVKEAIGMIGVCYLYGYGVDTDYQKAHSWLNKALAKGDTGVNIHIAYAYQHGFGVEKNERKALLLYQPFANNGNTYAQYQIAQIYYNSTDAKDCKKALEWFEKVANKYYDVLVIMGEIYEGGQCFLKDLTKAKECFLQASNYGIPLGEYHLGAIYYDEKKYQEAFTFLLQAAEDTEIPVPEAMRKLAACYRYGLGTPQDNDKEQYWMEQAAKHKDYKALDILNEKIVITIE